MPFHDRLCTARCAKAPPAGLSHCPLMRGAADLHAEFALARAAAATAGVDGLIVWGSHGDARPNTTDCAVFRDYLSSTLGPYMAKVVGGKSGEERWRRKRAS